MRKKCVCVLAGVYTANVRAVVLCYMHNYCMYVVNKLTQVLLRLIELRHSRVDQLSRLWN